MTKKNSMSREEISWILYDVANSSFVLVMITALMPIFFKDFAAAGMVGAVSTAHWAFANSAASFILAILAPILGALADYRGRKKLFFLFFLFTGLIFNCALPFVEQGQWLLCLVLFVCARVGWAGANVFYDSFLVDVTIPERMDTISTRGFGYGYIGSVIPFVLIIALIITADKSSDSLPIPQTKVGFFIVALWWLLLSIPAILKLKQIHYQPVPASPLRDSFRKLRSTLKNIRQYRRVFLFLTAYFFYIDGVGTVISMSTAYGRDLGFGVTQLIIVLLFIQIVAFPFALLYGMLANYFSPKAMIQTGIFIYCIITVSAFFLPSINDVSVKTILFWIIAFLIASSMGGIQALSRSYFGKLIPPEKSGEFFGFYNVFGKFAAIGGPLMMGTIGQITGETRWGILSLLLLFILGTYFLRKVDAE